MTTTRKTFIIVLCMTLVVHIGAQPPQMPSSDDVEEMLQRYHTLGTNMTNRIQASCTETNVFDVFPLYLAGWLHSPEAIPIILAKLELPGANEPGTRRIAKRPPGGFINPIVMVSAGVSPTPPTPASGVLALLPVDFPTLTNLLCNAAERSLRQELIAWATQVRFPNEFQALVNGGVSQGKQPWMWIHDLQTNEWEPEPSVPINAYRPYFPEEDVSMYTNLFYSLRAIVDYAHGAEIPELVMRAKSALEEIGHPYDEDPALWPR